MLSHPDPLSKAVVEPNLNVWAAATGRGKVSGVARLNGHSGVSYRFECGEELLVVRLAPPGVTGLEGADVLRQVPVLKAAHASGVPVPAVVDHGNAAGPFGTDFMIVEFITGALVGDIFVGAVPPPGLDVDGVCADAMRALAQIHAVPVDDVLAGWDTPRTTAAMLDQLGPSIERAEDPQWVEKGRALGARLRDRQPVDPAVGLVHNDYYSNNWITDGVSSVSAVLDWETACIGPVASDLGWIMMMHDRESWSPKGRPEMGHLPSPKRLRDWYEASAGRPVEDLEWFRAFACYRLLSGISFYLRLHRRGRRVDDVWEQFALSVPYLVRRANQLLG